ncbi:CDP-diacylglycerol--glycerol-3-phosphate 3-phosphatidyltransferase [Dictyocoela roeselum]|nr:CDP-diacylglycerol--glycerol-3-phosphate 3-phosphatidyltransferase [Dictyocoela roeselum]
MDDFMRNFDGRWYNIEKLDILANPSEFFDRIKYHLLNSTRAYMMTLYIGGSDEKSEHLFELLRLRKERGMHTKIIIDQNRGEEERTMINITRFGLEDMFSFADIVRIPLPAMLKQMICVLHKKVYIFDDVVILTGANLGGMYFSQTFDRYYEVQSQELASYLIYTQFNEFVPYNEVESDTKVLIPTDDYGVLFNIYNNFKDPVIASPYPNLPGSYIKLIKDNVMIVSSPECNTFHDKPFIKSIFTLILKMLSKKMNLLFYCKQGHYCHIKGKFF